MKIAEILARKGRGVVTMWPNHALADAVRLFDEKNVSSVVIVDPQKRPLGLVADRDVVHAVARHGAAALARPVTEAMVTPMPSCTPGTSLTRAMSRMTQDRIRHLVVMDDEEMIGIVSIGDLVKERLDEADIEGRVLRDRVLGRIVAE